MKKAEILELVRNLSELENKIVGAHGTSLAGDFYGKAVCLCLIRDNNYFKGPRIGTKMVYPTFKSYLEHFDWSEDQLKLTKYLMSLYDMFQKEHVSDEYLTFPKGDLKFWAEFKKLKDERVIEAIYTLKDEYGAEVYTTGIITRMFEEHPEWKRGYSAVRNLPSTLSQLLAAAKKVTDEEIDDMDFEDCSKEKDAKEVTDMQLTLKRIVNVSGQLADTDVRVAEVSVEDCDNEYIPIKFDTDNNDGEPILNKGIGKGVMCMDVHKLAISELMVIIASFGLGVIAGIVLYRLFFA